MNSMYWCKWPLVNRDALTWLTITRPESGRLWLRRGRAGCSLTRRLAVRYPILRDEVSFEQDAKPSIALDGCASSEWVIWDRECVAHTVDGETEALWVVIKSRKAQSEYRTVYWTVFFLHYCELVLFAICISSDKPARGTTQADWSTSEADHIHSVPRSQSSRLLLLPSPLCGWQLSQSV